MFVDHAKIILRGGKGGDGCVAFRREKYVPRGGPSGGDGGQGGNVYLEAISDMDSLLEYKYKRVFEAEAGKPGQGGGKRGANGEDLILPVPVGTVVISENDEFIADLSEPGKKVLVAKGGKGGRGNAAFATSTRRAPHFAERGDEGEEIHVSLELRVIADLGIIGPPNAGKSTLLRALTASQTKISDYPFTTLSPALGVLEFPDSSSLILAEIPGLIDGAHRGAGLGDQFLRHALRTRALLYLMDLTTEPFKDWLAVRQELGLFQTQLTEKPFIVVLNKADLVPQDKIDQALSQFSSEQVNTLVISAKTGFNLIELSQKIKELVESAPPVESPLKEKKLIYNIKGDLPRDFRVIKVKKGFYRVEGQYLEKLVKRTDLENDQAVQHLRKQMDKLGVEQELRKAGIEDGDTVEIAGYEFLYQEDKEK